MLGAHLEVEMLKSARRCGEKHIWKSAGQKDSKTPHGRSTFGSYEVEKVIKCRRLWREAHLEVKSVKN
jgi:hypothetical protein